ncbi:MAG: glycosyltransferase family 2 protein [Anaerolineae bacterium]|nr:glycosyltransferase family 2 protein [Anaerolineae bacterium]
MNISLVIPAYNEAEGVEQTALKLTKLLARLRKQYGKVEVIFVNDGSKDNTAALLNETFGGDPDVRIISHEVNRGLGAALRTGFMHTTGDIIITTDFDGTYHFNTIPQILAHMQVYNVDIVTASPYHPRGGVEGVPGYRLLFSYGASLLYRLLVNWNVHTWTALFRAYRREVIETVGFESEGFLAGTELLIKAIQAGYKVSEYPTTLHVRTFGQSSIKIYRVTKAHMQYQLTLLASGKRKRGLTRRRA